MEDGLDYNPWLKKIRWLSHALIMSGALNLGFLATFFVLTFKNIQRERLSDSSLPERQQAAYISSTGVELLSEYFEYSYDQLRKELESKEWVEDGYAKRDYALACLVAFHDFDIHKALSGTVLQTRILEIVHKEGGERMKLEVFPGLGDAHFQALIAFSRVEKWPFTPQGLFVKMQRIQHEEAIPPSLKAAFYLTPQFHCFWRLFQKVQPAPSSQELLKGLLSVDWEYLDGCYYELCRTQDFGEEGRRKFLLPLMEKKSSFAADYFLHHDREFALTKFDDESVLYMLSRLDVRIPKADAFARQLLVSVRSDKVLRGAGYKLYELAGEKPPRPYDHTQALMRFLPNFFDKTQFVSKTSRQEYVTPPMSAKRYHTVVKGDTLWQIAAAYHISLKELMKTNHITSATVIKPGMKLELP